MQEQRKSAAKKIAVWYKRLSETKQARQSLKAHRQLLPLTSLDRRREEEEKVAAASTIICFLQDIQRGHSFVRAVQTFHLKVRLAVQDKKWKGKERKGKERKGKERKGKERKGQTTPCGVNLLRNQVLYWAAQADLPYTTACSPGICTRYCHALPVQT